METSLFTSYLGEQQVFARSEAKLRRFVAACGFDDVPVEVRIGFCADRRGNVYESARYRKQGVSIAGKLI